jgi:RHH-type proline utilization regulon transcriptional repressor/proline dehydrogenase/delta 1-pyrroline-5-carboxylate dehydrogenase
MTEATTAALDPAPAAEPWRGAHDGLDRLKHADEVALVEAMLSAPPLEGAARAAALEDARAIVRRARSRAKPAGVLETFLDEFGLTTPEGLALMCLAEALLRVPDEGTADRLIAEKITAADWAAHAGKSDSLMVNASVWGLMLTGKVVDAGPEARGDFAGFLSKLTRRAGEPVIRAATAQAMRIMGEQFVVGRTIEAAIKRGKGMARKADATCFSFDMLGEGARTMADAARHREAYAAAIAAVAASAQGLGPERADGVSVKLSALHPRFEARQADRVHAELYPVLLDLARQAKAGDIGLCLDAEEADRLVLSLELLDRLCREPSLQGWDGLGLAIQAYQKRAPDVVRAVVAMGRANGRRLMARLVKGAYWDAEIKRAQTQGRPDYPVFTTKPATDVSYLACARAMLAAPDAIYPQFATHNAHTLAAVRRLAIEAGEPPHEFQRLHGMGETLYATVRDLHGPTRVRVYAPVGAHEDLLPYLVRRLLENGANTSFVHAFLDESVPVERVAGDPITALAHGARRHPRVPPPPRLFGEERPNSAGLDLTDARDVESLKEALRARDPLAPGAGPIAVRAPADLSHVLGRVTPAGPADVEAAFAAAKAAQPGWDALGGRARGAILRKAGDLLEARMPDLVARLCREAGKTLQDGIDEVREAVDFCRYYAAGAERDFSAPQPLPGPAGETNALSLHGRGVFVCISPWNFPLAIFVGQIVAALAAGCTVVAKPAEQTPLIALEAKRLLHEAGVPTYALHLLIGDGEVGARAVADPRVAGVAFTGSTAVARLIARALAAKEGPIAPLIAETGGLNAMFVDTTALKEQVVDDVIVSAFGSAGQRCSALRLLFLPHDTADAILEGLVGAMAALRVGDPGDPATDIGPVIDAEALSALDAHVAALGDRARLVARVDVSELAGKGHFFGPTLLEIDDLDALREETFGPVLHVLRYDPEQIATVGAALAAKGFGLTLGCHSRLDGFVEAVGKAAPAGNFYVNRTMIGAVVGVQPFGGEGLSGTGPKAGGPHYLHRFAVERTRTINIAAQGGDPRLFNL